MAWSNVIQEEMIKDQLSSLQVAAPLKETTRQISQRYRSSNSIILSTRSVYLKSAPPELFALPNK